MKIVHVCLGSFFPDNYSYQENMLPKFHKQLGYEVEVIASLETFDKNGEITYIEKASTYKNEYDIKVVRLSYKEPVKIFRKLKRYVGTFDALVNANPDILFVHNLQFMDIKIVAKYCEQHKNVKLFVDNHADFSNSAKNWISKNILHKVIWRYCAKLIEPYTIKFYGVLPARVKFLQEMYKIPNDKIVFLPMGADDDEVEKAKNPLIIYNLRAQYNIKDDDFLIVTGGKIDLYKTQILLLMEAVRNINSNKVKLLFFGSIVPELKDKIYNLLDGEKIQYIGWIKANDSYKYFSASDLVVFPGRHSVLWEQAVGQGKPLIIKDWEGTHHVDLGGNVEFLTKDSVEEIQLKIEELIKNPNKLKQMQQIAENEGMKFFSYKEIAKRSIEVG